MIQRTDAPAETVDRDLHIALTRVRIALLQWEACEKLGVAPPSSSHRRRRGSYTSRKTGMVVASRPKVL
ncbi:hypothetical protein VTH06DRAFT_8329 [Thermothelomyces fergusii]